MWIKTETGALVNCDPLDSIVYSEEDHVTYGYKGEERCVLSHEDSTIMEICSAMHKKLPVVSVGGYYG